jgi:hypothetical protein
MDGGPNPPFVVTAGTSRKAVAVTNLQGIRSVAMTLSFWLVLVPFLGVLVASNISGAHAVGDLTLDFKGTIWIPMHDVFHGRGPYPPATFAGLDVRVPSVYPPFSFLFASPLSLLSYRAAAATWEILLVASAAGGLWLVGTRDPRCYAVALLCLPVTIALAFGNLTLLLLLPLGLAWRWRAKAVQCGVALGVAIVLKLLVLPCIVWLIVTRRYRAAVLAATTAGTLLVVPWLAIGLSGARDYPRLLRINTDVYMWRSRSLTGFLFALGAPRIVAMTVAVAVACLLVGLNFRLRNEMNVDPGDADAIAFALSVVTVLVVTPIGEDHYYALLLIPTAILWPRFNVVWGLFAATWIIMVLRSLTPFTRDGAGLIHGTSPVWQLGGYVAFLAIVVAAIISTAVRSPRWSATTSGGAPVNHGTGFRNPHR